MKKKSTMIAMVVILLLSTASAFTRIGLAAEVAMSGNGANDAVITDASGHEIGHNESLSKYVSYQVTYHWHIPDGTKIKEGDTATFTLPNNVIPRDNIGFNIVYQGNVVGTYYQAANSQTGTLTFNDYFQKHPKTNIHGTLTIEVTGKEENEADNNDWMINKVGWFDGQNVPTWNVAMNPNNKHYDHLTVSDTMSDNQELIPGSVIVQYGHYNSKGTFIVERQDNHPSFEQNGQTLTFNFNNINSAFQIVYQVKPTIKDGTLTNSATVSGPDLSAASSSAWLAYGGSGDAAGDEESSTSLPITAGSASITMPTSTSTTTTGSMGHGQQPVKPSSTSSSTTSSSSEVVKPSSTSSSTTSSSSSEAVKPSSTSSSTTSSSSSEAVKPSSTSSSTTSSSSSEAVKPSSTSSSTTSISSSEVVKPSSTVTETTTSQSAAITPIAHPSQTTSSARATSTHYGTGANGVNNGHTTGSTTTTNNRSTTAIQPNNHSEKGYAKDHGGHGKVTSCEDAKVLPQTGTRPPYILMGVGSVIVVGVAFWYFVSRKQHD